MEYTKHEVIGRLIEEELIRNRHFRREVAKLPLGKQIFQVVSSPTQSVRTPKRKWYQKLVQAFKDWNNREL